jgi:hypothetical protein
VRDRHKKADNVFIQHLHAVAANLFARFDIQSQTEAELDSLEDYIWNCVLDCYEAYMLPWWLIQSLDRYTARDDKISVNDTAIAVAFSAGLTALYPDLVSHYKGTILKCHARNIEWSNLDNINLSPFQIACEKGDALAVRLMAQSHGALVTPPTKKPQLIQSLLEGVVRRGGTELVKEFVDPENNLTTTHTALAMAVIEALKTDHLDIADILLSWKLPPSGYLCACEGICGGMRYSHIEEIARLAVAKKSKRLLARIMESQHTIQIVLKATIREGDIDLFKYVLDTQTLPTGERGRDTMRICATIAAHNRTEMLDLLQDSGVDLHSANTGASALIVAAHMGNLQMVTHLLTLNVLASFPFPRRLHTLALQAAAYQSRLDVISCLLTTADQDLLQDTLVLAIDSGNPVFVHRLLLHGAHLIPSMVGVFTPEAFTRRKDGVQREYEELGLQLVNEMLYKRPFAQRAKNWNSWVPPQDPNEVVRVALAMALGEGCEELEDGVEE